MQSSSYQNQDALRSGARPAAPRQTPNSVRAASAIYWPPTPRPPDDQPRKLAYTFSSNVVSLDGDGVVLLKTNLDSGITSVLFISAPLSSSAVPPRCRFLRIRTLISRLSNTRVGETHIDIFTVAAIVIFQRRKRSSIVFYATIVPTT